MLRGAEYSLLKIEEINADNVKNIVIEIHDMDNHREELYEIGTQLFNIRGYRATDAAGLDVSLENFIRGSGTNVFKFVRATHQPLSKNRLNFPVSDIFRESGTRA